MNTRNRPKNGFSGFNLFTGLILAIITATILTAPCHGAADYRKADTWPQTMLNARNSIATITEENTVNLGAWYMAGPIAKTKLKDKRFPEDGVDLAATGKDGKKLWKKKKYVDGFTHSLPSKSNVSTYLYRTITVPEATTVNVGLGSDDGLAAFLNGKRIHFNNASRGVSANQDRIKLDLVKGENQFMMKVANGGGSHGFYFGMKDNSPTAQIWHNIAGDFPFETGCMKTDLGGSHLAWLRGDDKKTQQMMKSVLSDLGKYGKTISDKAETLKQNNANQQQWLALYANACSIRSNLAELENVNFDSLRLAIADLTKTYPDTYTKGDAYLTRIDTLEKKFYDPEALTPALVEEIVSLQKEALLANPLMDFDKLLLINRKVANARKAMGGSIAMVANWMSNSAIGQRGHNNEIAMLSPVRPDGEVSTLYKPKNGEYVGEFDLDFDASKLMFSMPAGDSRWGVFEIDADGKNLRKLDLIDKPAVSNYDSCYLPNGDIAFTSTATYAAVPCISGGSPVTNMYLWQAEQDSIRRLTFDQEHNWQPVVLNNGRILYTRWEYTDTPHYFTRILFHMNPDGTEQMEYYGSNSYFPNSVFYTRPIPNHPTKVVGIVTGHHGIARSGRLMIFDPAISRKEADGVVQEIPFRDRTVEPIIKDRLVDGVWPQFLHPYPLSDKYFLVSGKLTPNSLWGIYLVDVFDNVTLVKELDGSALLEPVPFVAKAKPPVIPSRVNPKTKDAIFYLEDVYAGAGLRDIPKGTVKKLRVFTYTYAYNKVGSHEYVGQESAWDVRRILGEVDVEEDGSAMFKAPANTPLSFQPLDEQGRAMQLMQSWTVGMPGEVASCVGCHEPQSMAPTTRRSAASLRQPSEIEPWYGPARPFAFRFEIQPILDKKCNACHGENAKGKPSFVATGNGVRHWDDMAYQNLHPYVRRPGPESDYYVFQPFEYHVNTSELVQMLTKGHYNVQLSEEEWDKLTTWIDFNVPYAGTWNPPEYQGQKQDDARRELEKLYANIDIDTEGDYAKMAKEYAKRPPVKPQRPKAFIKPQVVQPDVSNWPFNAAKAKTMQNGNEFSVNLGDGIAMKFVKIPAGQFVMGDANGKLDEIPLAPVKIDKPFWMGTVEVTNRQFAQFDPTHDSRYIDQWWKDHTRPGYDANLPKQPVIRISWQQAMDFCQWLSEKTGKKFTLPTEAQWEWACRAGSDKAMWYGDADTDFAPYANLADVSLKKFSVTGVDPKPRRNPNDLQAFLPRINSVNDGQMIMGNVGSYKPNPWGLYDMHGSVAEWTRSSFKPYPYKDNDGRNSGNLAEDKVARGGSWRDRPKVARSAYRLPYHSYQRVYNVGFRVILEENDALAMDDHNVQ